MWTTPLYGNKVAAAIRKIHRLFYWKCYYALRQKNWYSCMYCTYLLYLIPSSLYRLILLINTKYLNTFAQLKFCKGVFCCYPIFGRINFYCLACKNSLQFNLLTGCSLNIVFSLKCCDFSELCKFCCNAGVWPTFVYKHWHRGGNRERGQSPEYILQSSKKYNN